MSALPPQSPSHLEQTPPGDEPSRLADNFLRAHAEASRTPRFVREQRALREAREAILNAEPPTAQQAVVLVIVRAVDPAVIAEFVGYLVEENT